MPLSAYTIFNNRILNSILRCAEMWRKIWKQCEDKRIGGDRWTEMEQNNGTALAPPDQFLAHIPSVTAVMRAATTDWLWGRGRREKKKKNTKPAPPMDRLNYDSTPFVSTGMQVSTCFISFSSIKMISRREWSVSLSEPRCCVAERGHLKSCLSPRSTLIWVEETVLEHLKKLWDGWKTTVLMSFWHTVTLFLFTNFNKPLISL